MADVLCQHRRRKRSWLKTAETTCRTYDNGITTCIWLLGIVLFWYMIADTVVRTSTVEFSGTRAAPGAACAPYVAKDRSGARTLRRVLNALEQQCQSDDVDVVVGPQVHVDGKPYMKRVLTICNPAVSLINPHLAVVGARFGTCIDEVGNSTRKVVRSYPITLHADNREPVTALELVDVCSLMQALDMLEGIW